MTSTPNPPPPLARHATMPWPARIAMAPFHWVERARGRWRFALLALYALILAALGLLAWRAGSLRGLPDVGDPFDTAEFAVDVPDDRNAFVLYRQASAALRRLEPAEAAAMAPRAWDETEWSRADPALKDYVGRNREALAIWLRGSERPDAQLVDPLTMTIQTRLAEAQELRDFARIAVLEASRLRDEGDLEGAWALYRGVLRASRHVGTRGSAIQGLIGMAMARYASEAVLSWAGDPRVDPGLLRRALEDVREADAMTRPTSEWVKVEYLIVRNSLLSPAITGRELELQGQVSTREIDHLPGAARLEWFLKREPERSLRLVRLIYANWLSQIDRPPPLRSPIVKFPEGLEVYDVGPSAPPGARALPPAELAAWFGSTRLTREYMPAIGNLQGALDGDRRVLGSLTVSLAELLYEREHGKPPATLGALVGPYLDRLPEGYEGLDQPEKKEPQKKGD